ncbi:uncharacterized protein LOC135352306 isoform X3 [Halichondria panicea]|uniref:uncharacterized protein LOC135352306 isoform X3 n=1 Tax=Halichondria panicea TaxID=6063 RepID=UPI00312B63ED
MATQATPDHSPEYLSIQENFEALVSTFKAQPAAYADSLFSNGYIPDEVLEYSRLNGVMDSDKSRKILDTIIHRIKLNPSVFHGFIAAIAGPSTDDVVKKLHDSYERHKTATSRVEQPQLSPPPHQQPPPEAPTSFSFPHLDTSSLNEDDRIELEDRLIRDTRKMIIRFTAFTLIIQRSFENQRIPLDQIKDSVLSLESFNDGIGIKVLDAEDRQEIKNAKNLAQVFMTLRAYISFFNYEIVEYLIELLGSPDDQTQLREYCSALDQFCQRNVFEVPAEAFSSKSRIKTAKVFVIKCTERIATLEYVKRLTPRIAEALGLQRAALQLCSIKQGCLELHFLVTVAVAKRIYPVSPTVQAALSAMGVKVLTCGSTDEVETFLLVQDLSKLKLKGVEEMSKDTRTSMTTFTQMKDTKDTRGSDTVEATKRESKDTQPVKKAHCEQIEHKDAELVRRDAIIQQQRQGPPPRELRPPLTLKWRRGKDMPIKMGRSVQSVVIGDTVYVGGGLADNGRDECTVMKLDQDQWTELPEYTAECFAMTSLANRLVLMGGYDPIDIKPTNQLAVFESEEWTHPYPPMNIARHSSTAVSFNNYIIVAGGHDDKVRVLSSVEVLDVASRRWYIAQSLPNPLSELKSTLIGNTLYLMGGFDHTLSATKTVHHVDLNELIAKALSNLDTPTLWQTLQEAPLELSAPLSIGRSLLAVGGRDDRDYLNSSIHLYQPDTRRWVKVGDLPTARYFCTCSVLPSGEVIVAGGQTKLFIITDYIPTVDFFSISAN